MTGFDLQKRANAAADVAVGMLLSSPRQTAEQSVKSPSMRFHCKATLCILGRDVICLRRGWNVHFSEEDIQLAPANEASVTIRLWYTLGEVQEGESATH